MRKKIILSIRHQQTPFRDVKRVSSKKIKGWEWNYFALFFINNSSPPVEFLGKGIRDIYSKFTGECPCRNAI